MDADLLAARLLLTIPASLGAWAACATWTCLVRAREPRLCAAIWWWPLLTVPLLVAGLPAGTFLGVQIVAPAGRTLGAGWVAWAVLGVWSAGAVVAVSASAMRRRRFAEAVECAACLAAVPEGLVEAAARAAARCGVRAPSIVVVPGGGTAFVCNVRGSPVLVVPVDLWGGLGEPERQALLLHEMAHIRRRDPAKGALISGLTDILWPAVGLRLAAARLAAAWEESADAEALRGGATRAGLARTLVAAWEQGPATPARCPAALAFSDSAQAVAARLEALRARPARGALALRIAVILLVAPWCPAWAGGSSSCRADRAGDASQDDGRVHVQLGAGMNPAGSFVFRSLLGVGRPEPGAAARR